MKRKKVEDTKRKQVLVIADKHYVLIPSKYIL